MSSIFEKIRTYGVRGIRDHFAGKLETRLRRALGQRARAFVQEHFSIANFAESMRQALGA